MKLNCRTFVPRAISIAAIFACVSPGKITTAAEKQASSEKERKLIAILQSDAPAKDKAVPCKQLAVYGTKAAVPALAPLLSDPQLSSWARIALEAIPDPAAGE